MMIRNEEKRIGWSACALARHVDALVVRDDDSDDGTGMCPLISAVQTPEVPNCLSFPRSCAVEELLQAQQRCGFELNLIHAPKPWKFHEVPLACSAAPFLSASQSLHSPLPSTTFDV